MANGTEIGMLDQRGKDAWPQHLLSSPNFTLSVCDNTTALISTMMRGVRFLLFALFAVASTMTSGCANTKQAEIEQTPNYAENFAELAKSNGKAIGDAIVFLIESNQITYQQALELNASLLSDVENYEDVVFLGSLCSLDDRAVCNDLLIELAKSENPRDLLVMARQIFMGKNEVELKSQSKLAIEVNHLDNSFVLPIPQGYCDVTNSEEGQYVMEMTKEMRAQNDLLPISYFAFASCDGIESSIGYVSLSNAYISMR
tara:strand:- start:228 stop:1001 length:774 start_codon:yes stop_codon:yes gene_type:complete